MISTRPASETIKILLDAAALTAAGIAAGHEIYVEMKEKERLAEIAVINAMYRDILQTILVENFAGETLTLPPIFECDNPYNPTTARGLQITDGVLDDMSNATVVNGDPHLESYTHTVMDALNLLRRFYVSRFHRQLRKNGTNDDVTSSVLCYLILMIHTHCLKFEGADNDIAYLTAIAKFVTKFASLHKSGNSDRFERITAAYDKLLKARDLLKDHNISLSIELMLSGKILPPTTHVIRESIKTFAKLIISPSTEGLLGDSDPQVNWRHLETTTMDDFKLGMIKPEYENSHNISDSAILLPDSIFKYWIQILASDYLLCLDTKSGSKGLSIFDKKFNPEILSIEEVKKCKKLFNNVENILTRIAEQSEKNKYKSRKKLVPVSETKDILRRVKVLASFATLIDRLNALKYYFLLMWNDIKKFGVRSSLVPNQSTIIYTFLERFGLKIKALAKDVEKQFHDLEKERRGGMMLDYHNVLAETISKLLNTIQSRIAVSIAQTVEQNKKRTKHPATGTAEDLKKSHPFLVQMAIKMAFEYQILTKAEIEEIMEHDVDIFPSVHSEDNRSASSSESNEEEIIPEIKREVSIPPAPAPTYFDRIFHPSHDSHALVSPASQEPQGFFHHLNDMFKPENIASLPLHKQHNEEKYVAANITTPKVPVAPTIIVPETHEHIINILTPEPVVSAVGDKTPLPVQTGLFMQPDEALKNNIPKFEDVELSPRPPLLRKASFDSVKEEPYTAVPKKSWSWGKWLGVATIGCIGAALLTIGIPGVVAGISTSVGIGLIAGGSSLILGALGLTGYGIHHAWKSQPDVNTGVEDEPESPVYNKRRKANSNERMYARIGLPQARQNLLARTPTPPLQERKKREYVTAIPQTLGNQPSIELAAVGGNRPR